MSHYKTNLRDIEFNLFEVLGRDEVLGTGPFGEIDGESAREILREVVALFVSGRLAPLPWRTWDVRRAPDAFRHLGLPAPDRTATLFG